MEQNKIFDILIEKATNKFERDYFIKHPYDFTYACENLLDGKITHYLIHLKAQSTNEAIISEFVEDITPTDKRADPFF